MAASEFDLDSTEVLWSKSGVFARALTYWHVQRNRSYYLKRKHQKIDKENLIKIVKTLVERLNIV